MLSQWYEILYVLLFINMAFIFNFIAKIILCIRGFDPLFLKTIL